MAFVYHLVPNGLRGDVIYPLNQLASIHPDLYDTQRAKYVNREESLEFRRPGCRPHAIGCAPWCRFDPAARRNLVGECSCAISSCHECHACHGLSRS